ncbi:MAG: putative PEP-binding protein [Ilumatobacteraceae bacterium]
MSRDLASLIATAVRDAVATGTNAAVAAALHAVRPDELSDFFHASLAAGVDAEPLTTGLPASPGAASGRIVLSAEEAMRAADAGLDVILVRAETTPDDVYGMQLSRGILTARGGMASHAAVVARGWGTPAVVGAADVEIGTNEVRIGTSVIGAGELITVDGSTGHVYRGALGTSGSAAPAELDTLLAWADAVAAGHVQVRANADTADDAHRARTLGAQGIGLCRTEHMFLSADRLPIMRRFILADDDATEQAALAELEAAQTHDFEAVLEAMDGLPVTVRLLDPPLHEFLPDLLDLHARDARGELDPSGRLELAAVRRLHEANPMIGTRGVRLGLVRAGLYQMQVRALCTAAAALYARGRRPCVEIMIPLVVEAAELRIAASWVREVLDEIGHPELHSSAVTVGVMIETPRAALVAGELATHADFFSFGTNDLTQMTYAFSRDDVESKLLPTYLAKGILPANPFAVLDQVGVGELVRTACNAARAVKPSIKLGACGEHAGHPDSAAFLVHLGLDAVSCSPYRVPLARLGVAQALLDCGRVAIDDVDFSTVPAAGPAAAVGHDRVEVGTTEVDDGATGVEPGLVIDDGLVLHVLRLRGFVTPAGFTASLGRHPTDVLDRLIEHGFVRYIEARDMYSLLPHGKQHHESLIDSFATAEVCSGLREHYERFLDLNTEFKELCAQWQSRDGQPNDHTDPDYDAACVARLAALNTAARGVLDGFAAALPRLRRYARRLDAAIAEVAAGDPKKFTGVLCESFHDVWMELHEDLVVLQRINRVAEGSF